MLEFAAPFDMDAFGQLDFLGDDTLSFVDKTHHVAAADVERHIVKQPSVLALDHGRPFHDAHVRHRAQRNQRRTPTGVRGRRRISALADRVFRGRLGSSWRSRHPASGVRDMRPRIQGDRLANGGIGGGRLNEVGVRVDRRAQALA